MESSHKDVSEWSKEACIHFINAYAKSFTPGAGGLHETYKKAVLRHREITRLNPEIPIALDDSWRLTAPSKLFNNPHMKIVKSREDTDSATGSKKDDGKLPIATVIQKQFPNAIKAISECSLFGHEKYKDLGDADWLNLHRVENGVDRYANAMMRHLLEAGIDFTNIDSETGLNHIKHAVWNALALLEIIERQKI